MGLGKSAIYTVAVGKWHVEYAQKYVDTLMRFGEYDGDVIVFTDLPNKFDSRVKTATIPNCLDPDFKNFKDITMYKMSCGRQMYGKYQRVSYFDSDHLVLRPLKEILSFDKLTVARESCLLFENKCHFGFMTPEELAHCNRLRYPALNSGFFSAPTPEIFEEFIERWSAICEDDSKYSPRARYGCQDQGGFNAAIYRWGVDYKIIPQEWDVRGEDYNPVRHPHAKVIHYFGKSKKRIFREYERIMGLDPHTSIVLNGKEKLINGNTLTYYQICQMAGVDDENAVITFREARRKGKPQKEGLIIPGEVFVCTESVTIDVISD